MNTPKPRSVLALAASVAVLTGCAAVAPTIVPNHPGLQLDFAGAEDLDPEVTASCERSLVRSLERRGFVLGRSGPRLRVHVAFWDLPSFTGSRETFVTADFSGTSAELLPRNEVVAGSSTGSASGFVGGLTWQPARARIATCAYGSERVAEVLVATLYGDRRAARHAPPRQGVALAP